MTEPQSAPAWDPKELDAWTHRQLAHMNMGLSPIALGLAAMDWAMHWATSPGRQIEMAQKATEQMQQWWVSQSEAMQGHTTVDRLPADSRFDDAAWRQWPYSALHEAFGRSAQWWQEASQIDGMTRHHQQLARFFARQFLDAAAPSNWPLSNPQVMDKTVQTWGHSWWKGLQNMALDAAGQTTATGSTPLADLPYAVGQQVAVTPGEVVARHDLFELIQYKPTTARVRAEPLLIVPSTIMKYYILDLSPHNSMVKHLVSQGYTVFIMSWRNPQADDRHVGMDDYLMKGVWQAMQDVTRLSGQARLHAMGYCLGGTFLSLVASWLGRQKPVRPTKTWPQLASVTLLAAQTDFSEPGELGLFIDEDQLRTLREDMAEKGYLSGQQMAGTFQFLNSRDLIWSSHIRRHLLGQDEVGNDMMSWNADTTRLPERMHNEYLTQLFLDNAYTQGRYRVNGEPVAVEDIQAPLMVVGTDKDHVSPWRSVFKIRLQARVDVDFILASGGHNMGIVSEPGHPHRHHQLGQQRHGQPMLDADLWHTQAARVEGSWWPSWVDWLNRRSSPSLVAARKVKHAAKWGAAPGRYVMTRYND